MNKINLLRNPELTKGFSIGILENSDFANTDVPFDVVLPKDNISVRIL